MKSIDDLANELIDTIRNPKALIETLRKANLKSDPEELLHVWVSGHLIMLYQQGKYERKT